MRSALLIIIAFAGVSLGFTTAQGAQTRVREKAATTAEPSEIRKVQVFLETAGAYVELGDYPSAQGQILEALKAVQGNDKISEGGKRQIIEEAKKYLERIREAKRQEKAADTSRKTLKQQAQLDEAERLSAEGSFQKASEAAMAVLAETDDPELTKRANAILARSHPSPDRLLSIIPQRMFVVGGWVLDLVLGLMFLLAIYILLKLVRLAWAWHQSENWKVAPIADSTGLGIAEIVVDSWSRWSGRRPSASAGLLKLELLRLPSAPRLLLPTVELDLTSALEPLELKFGALTLGGVAKAVKSVRDWFNATRPWVKGTASVVDTKVVVNLTRSGADGKTNSVTALADKAHGATAAEAAGFKMYYLIASKSTIYVDAAERVRQGLDLLRQYVTGKDPKQLESAHQAFRSVRLENPTFDEVHLYEGIALDLLERHDEAIEHFQYLARHTPELREKAIYNEAISRYRKYKPDELEQAIGLLDSLINPEPTLASPPLGIWPAAPPHVRENDLVASPIKALALAAEANVIAHTLIFWQRLAYGGSRAKAEQEILKRKQEQKVNVLECLAVVEAITNTLESVRNKVPVNQENWDELTRQQLAWAVENARGNAYLYCAINFLAPPHVWGEGELEQRKTLLQKACSAFKKCEILLPPGVETLTNLATTLLFLSKTADARDYAHRAIDLNPGYEYAYYRLAQTWQKDGKRDKVVEVLRSLPKPPGIPEFREFYLSYGVEPKA